MLQAGIPDIIVDDKNITAFNKSLFAIGIQYFRFESKKTIGFYVILRLVQKLKSTRLFYVIHVCASTQTGRFYKMKNDRI